ncbi:cytochrome C biogenesis protein [Thermomonas sp.]|uniref:tetratricopeptide repeat protein n=1 Tax=Thermomonas sp. TaxID=1971895 RepID=UPI002489DFAF|nr:cytochrome C biogenesis protein [Thermomonas sp.]MDI1253199.1 cytochrome C biogenesis protein [Thermomonas sp.]
MTTFIIIAILLVLAVLAVLLRPLWRHARGVAIGVGVIVAASTLLLYQLVGTPQALDPAAVKAPATLGDAITQLETELQRNPNQAEGWRLLAQAYQREEQNIKARDAYAKAAALAPADASILTEAAQSRALADDKRLFDAQAVALLQRALAADPAQQRARWFLGIAQRQAGDNAAAAKTWEPLLAQVDAPTAASLRKEIDNARAAAGLSPLPVPAAISLQPLVVNVSLDPELAARVRLNGNAVVFVIARAVGGPPMPVAAEKHAVSELPFTANLDDSDSPMPTMKLSQMKQVELVARMSASGNAMRQDGDLESKPVRVTLPATKPIELVIGQ